MNRQIDKRIDIMARDKLITIRIEGEKREAFKELAKSHNTDTASLLYDFISGCLDGRIDIKLVTGKGNRIDKIDNQLDSDRLDKLETATQRIDERVGIIAKKLDDWIEAFSDRLNDCGRELSDKMISLEHRLSTLSIQLDSQQDRQGENPDIEPVATVETVDTVEAVDETVEPDSTIETVQPAIGPVPGDNSHLTNQLCEGMTIGDRQGLTNQQLHEKTRVPVSTIEKWKGKIKEGEKVKSTKYPKFFKQWTLNLADSLWYEIN